MNREIAGQRDSAAQMALRTEADQIGETVDLSPGPTCGETGETIPASGLFSLTALTAFDFTGGCNIDGGVSPTGVARLDAFVVPLPGGALPLLRALAGLGLVAERRRV